MATPAQILGLGTGAGQARFELQTAFPGDGSITTKTLAQLTGGYTANPEFKVNSAGNAVQMYVREDAPLTSSSAGGPRTEFREMDLDGTTEAAWDCSTGSHWMQGRSRVMAGPDGHLNGVCVAQLHDESTAGAPIMILTQLSQGALKLLFRVNGTSIGMPQLDQLYQDDIDTAGHWFDWRIEINDGAWAVYYQNMFMPVATTASTGVDLSVTGTCYFKAGNYTQCTASEATDLSRYTGVEMAYLAHWHTGWSQPKLPPAPAPVSAFLDV